MIKKYQSPSRKDLCIIKSPKMEKQMPKSKIIKERQNDNQKKKNINKKIKSNNKN